MPLHPASDPVTLAEKFAQHMEDEYGVQLDQYRRAVLVGEIEALLKEATDAG